MSGTILPTYAADAYLYGTPQAAPQQAVQPSLLASLFDRPASPLVSQQTANQTAVDTLLNIANTGNDAGRGVSGYGGPGTGFAGPDPGKFGENPLGPNPAQPATLNDLGRDLGTLASFGTAMMSGNPVGMARAVANSPIGAGLAKNIGMALGITAATPAPSDLSSLSKPDPESSLAGLASSLGFGGRSGGAKGRGGGQKGAAPDEEEEALSLTPAPAAQAPSDVAYGMAPDFGQGVAAGLNSGVTAGTPSPGMADALASGVTADNASSQGGAAGAGSQGAGGSGATNLANGGLVGYAGGGVIQLEGGGKIAIGPGGGLDDLIPTSINGQRAAALSDGEFVVPADVVSMMGDGSSNAGARRLYDLVRQIRQEKTGTSKQAGPLPVGELLKRTMS